VLIWGGYLAAFWPAILSDDSLDQWNQLLSLQLTAYQPPLHTLTNWLITRLWLSPTAVAIAQIVALALALCLVLWGCARLGAPAWMRWATAVWLALVPANGFLTVTLWKDAPYTVAHVLLVALSVRLVEEQDEALGRPRFLVALVATLVAVALYRHNGAPVVAGYLVWLVYVVGRTERRRAIGVAVATVLAIVIVHQTTASVFRIGPIPAALRYQTPLHHVAAVVSADRPIAASDMELLERLMAISSWKARYRCSMMLPLIQTGGLDWERLDREAASFLDVWRRLLRQEPAVILRHQVCATALLWNPRAPQFLVYMEIPESGRALNLSTAPRSEWLNRGLRWLYTQLTRPSVRPITWGPALHGAIVIACALIAALRLGARTTLPFIPAVLHTFVLFVVLPSNEFRLQYPVYVVGTLSPLIVAALWTRQSAVGAHEQSRKTDCARRIPR
jgi:hypothetical protein